MREIGISPRFSRDKFVPLQTKQRYSTRDISGEVSLTLFFRGFVPFLSLADFVSRNKNLQVADLQRLKSCFGELVTATTRRAYSDSTLRNSTTFISFDQCRHRKPGHPECITPSSRTVLPKSRMTHHISLNGNHVIQSRFCSYVYNWRAGIFASEGTTQHNDLPSPASKSTPG